MMRGPTLAALVTAVAVLALPAPAGAALRWGKCEGEGHQCARLQVPLDRSGGVPGSVSLHVVRGQPFGRLQQEDGATLVLGGDPGEAITAQFALSDLIDTLRNATRRNRVVLLDLRGTGGSGPLRCRDLESATPTDLGREAEACAALLGARRGFYRTSDSVADIEALRLELGVERLTLVAVGYGAHVAQRYLLSHPDRVERMVLDAPVDAAGLDPLMLDSIAAARRVLPLVCRGGCPFSRDPVADAARLSGELGTKPLRGYVVGGDGERRRATLSAQELLFTLGGADSDLFTAADFPAAVTSALRGDPAPLFRLKRRAMQAAKRPPERESAATRAAVLCEEVRFPWAWNAGPAERAAAAVGAGDLLSAELARPFGPGAAIRSDLMRLCRRWPTASAGPPPEPGPMPDVSVLVLADDRQIRAPLETARRTAGRFARSQVLVAPSVFGTALNGGSVCVSRALKRFLSGRSAPDRCPESRLRLPAGRPLPTSLLQLRPVRGIPGRRGRLLRAVELTLSDWFGEIYSSLLRDPAAFTEGESLRLSGVGLRGGRWAVGDDSGVLDRFEFTPGVRLSIPAFTGEEGYRLRADGPGRLDARLRVGETDDDDLSYVVRGRIAGERVRARLAFSVRLLNAIGVGAAAAAGRDRPVP
jgi:pimeloyl-ACP methyl ester carboxylesterase